jgi:hypothetical protein
MTFTVSVELYSDTLSLKEICSIVGKEPTDDSYSTGETRKYRKRPSDHSALRWFSGDEKKESLIACFKESLDLLGSLNAASLTRSNIKPRLNIASFFEYRMFSEFSIPKEIVAWTTKHGFEIVVTSYPTLIE